MGQVTVVLNGRTYRLECGEGEESHLIALAEYLGTHVEDMKRKFGQVGDDRLILMASLLVTDELWELRREMEALKASLATARRDRSVADEIGEVGQGRSRGADRGRRRPARGLERAVRQRGQAAGQDKKASVNPTGRASAASSL